MACSVFLFSVWHLPNPLVFSFGFEKKNAMILQWVSSLPPDLLLVFATTLGVSDLAELNKTTSSANVSSIIDRFLYFNDASVPVSRLLIGSLKQRRRIFAWFFWFSFWGRRFLLWFHLNWAFLC